MELQTRMDATNNQSSLKKGFKLNRYRIIKQLGKGGFGITYLALDEVENKPVAIKEYFPFSLAVRTQQNNQVSLLSSDKENDYQQGLNRFEREAITLGEFNHPNIVKVHTLFKANNTAYFVMDYIEGQSLEEYQREKNRALTEKEVITHCLPILKGLGQVHKKDLLHLDIKPDNIIQTKYGQPLLIDFGGARFTTVKESRDLSQHSSMVATDGFAPTEQYSLVADQTPATDLYAFGMTLYHLIAPIQTIPKSGDRQDLVFGELPDPLLPIRDIAPGYSEALYKTIDACAQLKQKDRPQSVAEVESLLMPLHQQAAPEEEEEPIKDTPKTHKEKEARKPGINNKLLWKMIALIMIIGVFVMKVNQDHGTKASTTVEEYRKAAAQGDANAQYNLGVMYDNGDGVTQDYQTALKWYRKAAAQGDATAQYALGVMYDNGNGVTQDYQKALEWYRKAAAQGDAKAQYNLGVMYNNGNGVTQDYQTALKWYRKAAAQGHASAQYNLGVMYGNGNGVTQDYQKALEWYRKAAAQGDAEAQTQINKILDNK